MTERLSRITLWHMAGCLTVILLALYAPFLTNEFVTLDDGLLITRNPAVQRITGWSLKKIFTSYDPELYVPFTLLSYQMEFAIAGAEPFLYHLTNLILHTSNSILVLFITFHLSKSKWVAFFCGLLFAIHPLNVETVLWMSARKDLLSAFFFLWSCGLYLLYRDNGRRSFYIWSIVAFFCGLMAKVSVVTLPLGLLLFDWYQGRKIDRESLKEKIPYFSLSILFGLIAAYGKRNVISASDPLTTFFLAFKSTIFYLQKLFVPTKLAVIYPQNDAPLLSDPDIFIPILFVLFLIVAAVLARKKYPVVTFGVAFYVLILVPNYNNFLKNGFLFFASDRYAYLPSIGIIFLIGMLIHRFWKPFSDRLSSLPTLAAVLLTVIAGVFFARSHLQGWTWRDSETLYRNVILHYPDSAFAYNNLGDVLVKEERFAEAVGMLEKALIIKPDLMAAHVNMGNLYRETGKFDEAIASYKQAIDAVKNKRPLIESDVGAYYLLGEVLEQVGRPQESLAQFLEVVRIAGYLAEPHYNLALQYHKNGLKEKAIGEYTRTVEIQPNYTHAYYNLAALYAEAGKLDLAIENLEKLLTIDPYNEKAQEHLANMKKLKQEQEAQKGNWREVWIEN